MRIICSQIGLMWEETVEKYALNSSLERSSKIKEIFFPSSKYFFLNFVDFFFCCRTLNSKISNIARRSIACQHKPKAFNDSICAALINQNSTFLCVQFQLKEPYLCIMYVCALCVCTKQRYIVQLTVKLFGRSFAFKIDLLSICWKFSLSLLSPLIRTFSAFNKHEKKELDKAERKRFQRVTSTKKWHENATKNSKDQTECKKKLYNRVGTCICARRCNVWCMS